MQVHIGKEIERIYQHSGLKLSEFAKRINTSTRNVYSIFAREEIKTDQLIKIGEVLRFDFFSLYTSDGSSQTVNEPVGSYLKVRSKVLVTIELDGQQSTLDLHIRKLTAINQALNL